MMSRVIAMFCNPRKMFSPYVENGNPLRYEYAHVTR